MYCPAELWNVWTSFALLWSKPESAIKIPFFHNALYPLGPRVLQIYLRGNENKDFSAFIGDADLQIWSSSKLRFFATFGKEKAFLTSPSVSQGTVCIFLKRIESFLVWLVFTSCHLWPWLAQDDSILISSCPTGTGRMKRQHKQFSHKSFLPNLVYQGWVTFGGKGKQFSST